MLPSTKKLHLKVVGYTKSSGRGGRGGQLTAQLGFQTLISSSPRNNQTQKFPKGGGGCKRTAAEFSLLR